MKLFKKLLFITLGSFLFALGLEIFLVPNQIIDGGIVGISIMISHFSGIHLGILLVVLNLPFFIIGLKLIGKKFAFLTIYAVLLGAVFVTLLHGFNPLTKDLLLASIFGGIVLGIGVGLVIRSGGSLDGTEITAILVSKKLPFSVGEVVMFFNVFIFIVAGFLFEPDRALYSILAYFIAYKTIDITIEGLDETRSVWIISDYSDAISEQLFSRLGRGCTFLKGAGGYTGIDKKIIFTIVTRLEEAELKNIVEEIDPEAFVATGHIHDVKGGRFKKGFH